MTLVTRGTADVIEQITKQLNKLIDVVKLMDMYECSHIEREMMLIKVRATDGGRDEVKRLAEIFRGRIIDVTPTVFTVEVTGTSDKLDAFVGTIEQTDIIEVVRSGVTGIARGEKALHV
jgi:acetolactate synthase-1/3 small subunit